MTKKDYIKFAAMMRGRVVPAKQAKASALCAVYWDIAVGMACIFSADNPRFDRETFYLECGLKGTMGASA